MTLTLSVPEFFSQPSQPKRVSPWETYEIPLHDPKGQSRGCRRSLELRPGLNLLIDDYTLYEDLVVETGSGELHVPLSELEFSFMVSGNNRAEGVRPRENFLSGQWLVRQGGWVPWSAGEQILKVDIHVTSHLLETLMTSHSSGSPPVLRQVFENPNPQNRFCHLQITKPMMESAIHQILNCPYQGLTRQLYLESKVLELIALRLDPVMADSQTSSRRQVLRSDDLERIHFASEILLKRLASPPSMLELARLVGINDYKLKVGFRQVFNTTVFGYLRDQRLIQARMLLQSQQVTVTEAASAVGYASQGHFAAAFRKRFGVKPSDLLGEKYQR